MSRQQYQPKTSEFEKFSDSVLKKVIIIARKLYSSSQTDYRFLEEIYNSKQTLLIFKTFRISGNEQDYGFLYSLLNQNDVPYSELSDLEITRPKMEKYKVHSKVWETQYVTEYWDQDINSYFFPTVNDMVVLESREAFDIFEGFMNYRDIDDSDYSDHEISDIQKIR
jgi:hypothetical protein